MAGRPRKFVRIIKQSDGSIVRSKNNNGQEIDGLCFHKANRSYYTLDPKTGKRQFLGRDLRQAVGQVADVRVGLFMPDDGGPLIDTIEVREKKSKKLIPIELQKSKQRLSDCLTFWINWNTNDDPKAMTPNIRNTKSRFQKFIKCVGNLPINLIGNDDFLKWQKHISRKSMSWTVKTVRDYHSTVSRVLELAKRKNKDWDFPPGLLEWSADWRYDCKTPYREKPINKEPMPVEVFKRCLQQADAWANIDVDAMPNRTQRHKASRKVARDRTRNGVQLNAILRLAIHGLATIDLCRIAWSNIIDLDGEAYYDFPREKMKHRTGYAIDRQTRLLPSCVAALKAWRAYERPTKTVFRNVGKLPFNSSVLSTAFGQLKRAAGITQWTIKHLRNVGGTLADQNGMSEMMVDRFLGHTLKAARSKYLGSVDPAYLNDLVSLIGAKYCDGETITTNA